MNDQDIKIGSTVIISNSYGCSVSKVIGETKTSWRTENKALYDKRSLCLRGGDVWSQNRIMAATPKMIEEVRKENQKKKLVKKLYNTKWEKYYLEKLCEIDKIL